MKLIKEARKLAAKFDRPHPDKVPYIDMIGNLAGTIESLQADKAELVEALRKRYQKDLPVPLHSFTGADYVAEAELLSKHSPNVREDIARRNAAAISSVLQSSTSTSGGNDDG